MFVWILAALVLFTTVGGGGFLLWKKIPQRYLLHKGAMGSALRIAHEGHDLVAQVEWSDKKATFLGADYKPGDGQIVLDNGLPIEVVGNGADPIYIAGVPIVKVKAEHATPVDTDVAIAMGREEDGDYKIKYEDGSLVHADDVEDVDGSVSMEDMESPVDNPEEMLTDGGAAADSGQAIDRQYQTTAKDGAMGVAFSLRDATNHVPFSLTPGSLKKAYDIGKREGANSSPIKMLLMGMGVILAILLFLAIVGVAVYKILGMGGGGGGGNGGGGQTVNAGLMLLAMAAPTTSSVRDKLALIATRTRRRADLTRVLKPVLSWASYSLMWIAILGLFAVQATLTDLVLKPELSAQQMESFMTAYGGIPLALLMAWVLFGLRSLLTQSRGRELVTVHEYERIQALDDEYTTYAAIAEEVGLNTRAVQEVLEDGDYTIVEAVDHPKPQVSREIVEGAGDDA